MLSNGPLSKEIRKPWRVGARISRMALWVRSGAPARRPARADAGRGRLPGVGVGVRVRVNGLGLGLEGWG